MVDIPSPEPAGPTAPPETAGEGVAAIVWPWRDRLAGGGPAGRESAAGLRREGVVRALVGGLVASGLAFWRPGLAMVVGGVSLLVLVLALGSPGGAYARLSGWIGRFAHGVGTAVTWLLMPVLFYLLFAPVGLAMRLAGKLRLTRAPDPEQATYWCAPQGGGWGGGGERYRKQF